MPQLVPLTFDQLYADHAPALRRFSLCLSRDPAEAEEIVSETFFRAWTSPVPTRAATARSYLFTIARNLHYDRLRSQVRHAPLAVTMPSSHAGLEDQAALSQILEKIDTLADAYRMPLLLYSIAGLTYEEIAETLSLAPAVVKVRIHRARLKLTELLQPAHKEIAG